MIEFITTLPQWVYWVGGIIGGLMVATAALDAIEAARYRKGRRRVSLQKALFQDLKDDWNRIDVEVAILRERLSSLEPRVEVLEGQSHAPCGRIENSSEAPETEEVRRPPRFDRFVEGRIENSSEEPDSGRRPYRMLTPEEKIKIRTLARKGLKAHEIIEEVGHGSSTIRKIVNEENPIPTQGRGGVSASQIVEIRDRASKGQSGRSIARDLGLTPEKVYRHMPIRYEGDAAD